MKLLEMLKLVWDLWRMSIDAECIPWIYRSDYRLSLWDAVSWAWGIGKEGR